MNNKRLRIDEISLNDETYKISKNIIDDRLKESIRRHGILQPPLLLDDKGVLIPIIGHNRLKLAKELNTEYVDVNIIQKEDHETYIHYALIKNYNNEIGPLGKVKLYRILADSEVSRSLLARIASDDLKVPEYIRDSDSLIEEMLALPKVLYDYLDHREFSYKTIRMVAAFPVEIRDLLSRWLAETSLRKNIFKEVVEYVWDIYKRDLAINALIGIDLTSVDDNRKREDTLCGKLFELRYPEYSRRKMIFDEYKRRIEKKGFMVKYPEYFEGDNIVIGLKIEKTETPEFISRRLSEFNYEELYKLLQAL